MDADIKHMLTRMESRIVRGFSELGVDVKADDNWLTIDGGNIYITTLTRSLQSLLDEADKKGARIGLIQYNVFYEDGWVAQI